MLRVVTDEQNTPSVQQRKEKLANMMMDVCSLLGISKLNTTSYHPQCNGVVERMNRTLKAMLRKHAVKFGPQWDK